MTCHQIIRIIISIFLYAVCSVIVYAHDRSTISFYGNTIYTDEELFRACKFSATNLKKGSGGDEWISLPTIQQRVRRMYHENGYVLAIVYVSNVGRAHEGVVIEEGEIERICIDSGRINPMLLKAYLRIRAGDVYNALVFRRYVKDLYATDLFSDIRYRFIQNPETGKYTMHISTVRKGKIYAAGTMSVDDFIGIGPIVSINHRGRAGSGARLKATLGWGVDMNPVLVEGWMKRAVVPTPVRNTFTIGKLVYENSLWMLGCSYQYRRSILFSDVNGFESTVLKLGYTVVSDNWGHLQVLVPIKYIQPRFAACNEKIRIHEWRAGGKIIFLMSDEKQKIDSFHVNQLQQEMSFFYNGSRYAALLTRYCHSFKLSYYHYIILRGRIGHVTPGGPIDEHFLSIKDRNRGYADNKFFGSTIVDTSIQYETGFKLWKLGIFYFLDTSYVEQRSEGGRIPDFYTAYGCGIRLNYFKYTTILQYGIPTTSIWYQGRILFSLRRIFY